MRENRSLVRNGCTTGLTSRDMDLSYVLNSNSEWYYNGFTQLVHDKAEVNYFIGNEIFLVGNWRWASNYVAYNMDGSWLGRWDDGNEATGTWRIVRGNLVLTRAGENWRNDKIMQFSKNELLEGDNNERAERLK